jgi:6-phospho-beta-glucosidase
MRIAVVGGSSPFTLGLVSAIAAEPPTRTGALCLHGRDRAALTTVGAAAAHLFDATGWRIEVEHDPDRAIAGADVVLHQNRYGGLRARADDERLAAAHRLAGDETLGPAGLAAALRTWDGQRAWADRLAAAGTPIVVTTTNPLGISTSRFAASGLDVIGVCELPVQTRLATGAEAGAYTGLNHRGFWHHLAGRPDDDYVPDKYFSVLTGATTPRPGRADHVNDIRDEALAQASADPSRYPPALAGRDLPWHRLALVPVLAAIAGRPQPLVLTLPLHGDADPVCDERQVILNGADVTPVGQPPPPADVQRWYDRFLAHERAVLAAAAAPGTPTVARALELDPLVPDAAVASLTIDVLASYERWRC